MIGGFDVPLDGYGETRKKWSKIMSISEIANDIGIAIIGMAGRFPGADNIDQFWENLRNGVDALRHFSDEELEERIAPAVLNDPNYVKAGYILENVDQFDADFFNFMPSEADLIDPQQRLFLECAWEALENAGYVPENIEDAIGVYGSVSINSYIFRLASDFSISNPVKYFKILLGNDKDYLATHISYKLNLRGPSIVVQSACSSSLIGICLACQGLLDYHCDMALAGGVSVSLPQKVGHLYHEDGGLSRDGKCYTFDSRASGTMGGNGMGIVVLKRLAEAVEDGDTIYGIIRGFAVNNDGLRKVGFTAPSMDGQTEVIAEALSMAGVDPESVGYVEAHGTATRLGDPIEITALNRAYGANGRKQGYCAIGSVKTNIGHLDAAAGVSAIIKTALALKHKMLPPSLHFEEPNPEIDFDHNLFYVNTELKQWESDGAPLRAGVSSFGLGGSNAHLILEEAPVVEPAGYHRQWHLLVLSARTETALDKAAEKLLAYLKKNPDINLSNVAYTLQVGRKAFAYRRILVCQDRNDAISLLENSDPDRVLTSADNSEFGSKSVVFMFPGAGPQYVNMGLDLYQNESVFRETVDQCAEFLKPVLELDLRDVLYPKANRLDVATKRINEPVAGLPALFVTDYALARLWQSWGVEPAGMIGHSLGEYVAATLAGVFSLEDALSLVAKRGELMEEVVEGGMLVIVLPEEKVKALLVDRLSIAAVNGPSLCTVSGPIEDIDELQKSLKEKKIVHRRVPAGRAGHSSMIDPIIDRFRKFVSAVKLNAPKIPFLSNTTGTWITDEEATDPNYWTSHMRKTVCFSHGLEELLKDSQNILLEAGPGRGLNTFARRHPLSTQEHHILSSMRDERQSVPDTALITRALGSLWLSGLKIDWSKAIYPDKHCQRVPLPAYPFERQRYWVDAPDIRNKETTQGTGGGLSLVSEMMDKQSDIDKWFSVPSWKRSLPLRTLETGKLANEERCWLVFADSYGVGSAMVKRLRREGQKVIQVDMGDDFARLDHGTYRINPGRQEDYEALIRELVKNQIIPGIIAHLWSVTPDDCLGRGLEFYEDSQDTGYQSLIYIVRALASSSIDGLPLQLGVVSTNLYAVTGSEHLSPEKSTVLGPAKVIPSEFRRMECVSIDIELSKSDTAGTIPQDLVDTLIVDVAAYTDAKDLSATPPMAIAYRGKYRWEQYIEQVRLESPDKSKLRLRPGGVYLITGGLGGVPSVLARYLAQEWKAKLVLTGRTKLPERKEWETWLATHDEDDDTSIRLRKIMELEDLGAEVIALSADVSNMDEMRRAYTQGVERFGTPNGIFHAASLATSSMILVQTPERAASVIGPKVRGTLVLDELCRDADLDFFMLFSSISSFMGALGHADYTAANVFMDTYAHYMNAATNRRVVAVNWSYWHGVGIGLKLLPRLMHFIGNDVKIQGILPEEGIECINRAISADLPQIVVSCSSFPLLVREFLKSTKAALKTSEEFKVKESTHSRPKLGVPYVPPRNELEQTIADLWQELLGIDAVGVNDGFLELGGDSLHALPLITRLRETFHSKLPIRAVFSQNTVAKLAQFIVDNEEEEGKTHKIARAIQRVKSMSPEQVKAALQDKQTRKEFCDE